MAADACGDMMALAETFRAQYERNRRRFAHWFDALRQKKILDALGALLAPVPAQGAVRGGGRVAITPPSAAPRATEGALRPSRNRRVAAIDVGTNSIRMAVAETDPAIGFRIIEDVKETTRLGAGVFASGKLKVGAVKRSLTALERMRTVAENHRVDSLRAVATSAVREASNGADFVKLIRRRVGIPIEVIQSQREARLAFSGVARDFELTDHRVAVVDTGGGSTELVFATSGVIDAIRPVPLGAVRLTEAFGDPAQPGQYRFREMRKRIRKTLKEAVRRVPYRPDFIVGAGGTFTSLARVALREGDADKGGRFPFAVRGCELRHKTVARVLGELRRMTLDERSRVSGLSAKRAEIIVAGLCIVERLMDHLGVDRLFIHDGGIRDGLVAEMIDEMGFRCQPPRTHPEQVIGAVARYAERMKYPRDHSEHVARLSLRIFDALVELQPDAAGVWGKPAHRDLLRSAAMLHDVGHAVARKAHHKHAYDMILHADLSTLTRREIEIVANICRYHRRRGPRRKDPGFRKLGAEDQRIVAHLAGILRIADGLDYSQKQNVTDVVVRAGEDEAVFAISGSGDLETQGKRARQKADVFESAFHTRARFELRTPALAMQSA
jgi:exopolyphosphatase/guanosine-5'-triphosphate,3'-diphosphate pyrophosphatase